MKRKSLIFTFFLAVLIIAASCSADGIGAQALPKSEAVLIATIARVNEKDIFVAGEEAYGLYFVALPDDAIYDAMSNKVDLSALKAGQKVEIGYDGGIMESYPMQIGSVKYIKIVEEGNDLIGLYLDIFSALWEKDPGLNSDSEIIAIDLTTVTNLAESEKQALSYLFSGMTGVQTMTSTYDELVEQGLIDKDNLYFETGILFKLTLDEVSENRFTFEASKWKSGLGAYFFMDCEAKKTNGEWTYTIGSEAIS